MTAYAACGTFGPSTGGVAIGVLAGTYPCRIARVELWANFERSQTVTNYSGASFSGGTTVTPLAMRGGAPATTATVKISASMSGTATTITAVSAGSFGNTGTTTYGIPGASNYSFPFDYIVPPGSAIYMGNNVVDTQWSSILTIYYEELRLSWSF